VYALQPISSLGAARAVNLECSSEYRHMIAMESCEMDAGGGWDLGIGEGFLC